MKIIPSYHPPSDYRRPTKTQEKVYVPVNDYPEINFSMLANPLTLFLLLHFVSIALHKMLMAIESHTNLVPLTAFLTLLPRTMTNT